MRKIVRRIEREAGVPNLSEILVERIKPTDLQSLLLQVYQERVKRRSPRDVFSDYISNSFTLPSRCDPAILLEWDRIAFSHLPEGFRGIELSPVSPIGSVSRMAPISQDWVLTTIRNMEVVADPTNVLALECALRRQEFTQSEPTNATPVHLACSHRVVRAQRYRSPGALQNFRLFSLCSAGRTTGNLRFEIRATTKHIRFYLESLRDFLGSDIPLRVTIIDLSPDSHDDAIFSALLENLKNEFDDVDMGLEKAQTRGTEYYRELRFHVYASPARGHELELVDGGDTDWTQKLLNNAKERLIISGIGSERLCEKFTPIRQS
jgi:hypothetical protein